MTFIALSEVVKFCERVKGSNTLRLCPVCQGTGEFDTPDNMGPGVPKCPVCKGTGFVDMSSTCTCGMPALLFKEEVLYCGKDLCFNSQKHRRTTGFGC
jgi:DnaJ-class molecular chaperone